MRLEGEPMKEPIKNGMSPDLRKLLGEQSQAAETEAAIDAAAEEGIPLTPEQAEEILDNFHILPEGSGPQDD